MQAWWRVRSLPLRAGRKSSRNSFSGDEIAHPGIPGAAGDSGHRLIQRHAHDQRDDAGGWAQEWRRRGCDQKRAADARGPGGDSTPGAQALYQYDCRQLEELHGKGDRRKKTDREIAGAELHEKAVGRNTPAVSAPMASLASAS